MKPTITPTPERSIISIRRHAHRPHQAIRHPAAHVKSSVERHVSDASLRSSVADAFRRMAHGGDAATAEAQTKAFYRSSGHEWAQALEPDVQAVKAGVLEAFQTMLGGMLSASAHARTLRFYRSGGQVWALKL